MKRRHLVIGLLIAGVAFVGILGGGLGAYASTTKYITSAFWDAHHVYVTSDAADHLARGSQAAQDVIAHNSNHTKDTTALVLLPTRSGHWGIIVNVWTEDGYHKHQNDPGWHYHGGAITGDCGSYNVTYYGHPWGNGYDVYVGDNSSDKAEVYRFAHMDTDGTLFYESDGYVYSLWEPEDKLAWDTTLGYYGNTGYSCGQHLHWHIAVGNDSTRYAPTYASIDENEEDYGVYEATYNGHGPEVDELNMNCWVSLTNNCDPQGWW